MKIIAKQMSESVICILPTGDQVEITMLGAQGDECFAEPNVEAAVDLLTSYLNLEYS